MISTTKIATAVAVLATTSFLQAQAKTLSDFADLDNKPVKTLEVEAIAFTTQDLHKILGQSLTEFDGEALESSADLIGKASKMVSGEAGIFPQRDDQKKLKQDSKSLKKLATSVRDGLTKDSKDLKQAYSETNHLLAMHYITSSEGAKNKAQGNFLLGAAHHAEQAVLVTGDKVSEANKTVFESVRNMARELVKGGKVDSVKLDSGISDLTKACAKHDRTS